MPTERLHFRHPEPVATGRCNCLCVMVRVGDGVGTLLRVMAGTEMVAALGDAIDETGGHDRGVSDGDGDEWTIASVPTLGRPARVAPPQSLGQRAPQ